jgi:hypothetical protein
MLAPSPEADQQNPAPKRHRYRMRRAITPDMAITAEGRAYSLLCESEKWRVDAMIAAAIAELSGVKVMMLDRMDV